MFGNSITQLGNWAINAVTLFRVRVAVLSAFSGFLILASQGCGSKNDSADASLQKAAHEGPRLIKVSDDVAKTIELKTEPIARRALSLPMHVTGKIEPDFGKEVDVTSRITGRVTQILVSPGQVVTKGQLMATVDSQEISDLQAELIEALSKLKIAMAHEERERQVYSELLTRPKTLIDARTTYRAAQVRKNLAESEFKRQEGLYKEKISSQRDYLSAQATLAEAEAAYEQAKIDLQREENLFQNKAMLKRDLQLAQAETARERQHVKTLQQRLEFLGADVQMLKEVMRTGTIRGVVRIIAPTAGVVSHHDVAVGEVIHPEKSMFKVTDLSTVIVKADLPEVDLQRVRLGSKVHVRVASYPNEDFQAVISYISEHVNPDTRTVAIRARLDNGDRRFKSQMFAEIDLEGAAQDVLACPKSAVQELEGKKVVFVRTANGFEERHPKLGAESEKYYEVIAGLTEGEEVATQGSLMLKTELTYKH
ncbi:MAG TPA: efflux RND transporter periplasmic adaptor subunit [Candidatus Obscuribacterales bacterium]